MICGRFRVVLLLLSLLSAPRLLPAQVTAGTAEGSLRDASGQLLAGATILVTGGAGFRSTVRTNASGEFVLVAPYGQYRLSAEGQNDPESTGVEVYVAPLQITRVDLKVGASGAFESVAQAAQAVPGSSSDTTRGRSYPEGFSLASALINREPESDTQPLDFNGLSDNRLALVSRGALAWTDTQYKLNGMDATDSYQTGETAILPNPEALGDVLARGGFAQVGSGSAGAELGLFSAEASPSWHGEVSSADTGSLLTWANLPPPNKAGIVQQPEEFIWFTRDTFETGGPITKWADLFASVAGQWALQTVPLAGLGTNQGSHMLFGDLRSRIRVSANDQLDLLYSGSRVSLSEGGIPADMVDLMSRRMAPSLALPGGFQNEAEADEFNYLQAGWTHQFASAPNLGLVQVRYGYSMVHLDTAPVEPNGTQQQSSIELLGGMVTGAPPIADLATRERQEVEGAWMPAPLRIRSTRHQIAVGAGFESSSPTDRVTTPLDMNLVTVSGSAAFVVEFNTPLVTRELVRSSSLYVTDRVTFTHNLTVDLGAFANFSRGSLPAQSSPAGGFVSERTFAAQPDLISWNSISPRAALAWVVPHAHGLLVRAGFFQLDAPLAGRYLDFGNPNSLGGSQYQWNNPTDTASFEPAEQGALLLHFGGPYSSISPSLKRPYSDQIDIGAEISLARWGKASVLLYQRYENNRLAAIDTGVPFGAFTPVSVIDPDNNLGPAPITVYAQNPATFGQDRYLLTNPAGLALLNEGVLVEMSKQWRALTFHGSLIPEESLGPTNPGNSVFENDPGIVGSLLMDPNTTQHATGRAFLDRAWEAKTQMTYRLPAAWSGIELDSTLDYLDGLAFGRELLVTGLPQGPFLVQATRRGWSPQGGYRADFVVNWNLRLRRDFHVPVGKLTGTLDILNVLDSDANLQENDLTGPSFFLRLPVAVQPPRNIRAEVRYDF